MTATVINEYLLIPPNWANPVIYRRRWQTTLVSSLKADESRSALFTWPRRTISFTPLTKGFTESAYIKRKLHKNLDGVWGVPFWMDKSLLTSQAMTGQPVLNVNSTLYRNFEVGAPCLLFSSILSYEVRTILSKTDSQITLTTNLANTWDKETEVYPVMKARIKSGQVIDLLGSRFSQMEVEASEEFDDTITRYIGTASGFPLYQGSAIFNIEPDWAGEGEFNLINPYDRLSFFGKSVVLSEYDETEILLKLNFLEKSKSDIQNILDFFDSRMGRWGNFWTPSWQSDIRVTAAFGSGDSQLNIENIEFLTYWLNTGAGSYITLLFPDGTRINKKVIAAPLSTIITLDSPIGKACSVSSLDSLLVSFLLFGRFNQDEIEVNYSTDEIGKLNLTFRSLFSEGLS